MGVISYLSTFTSGFEPLVAEALMGAIKELSYTPRVSPGIVIYGCGLEPAEVIGRTGFFSNTFVLLEEMDGSASFADMARRAEKGRKGARRYLPGGEVTYRVRFHDRGSFSKVPREVQLAAERAAGRECGGRLDRVSPDVEFWYIRRADGGSYYALLTLRRAASEKSLRPGELRPELARMLCLLAGVGTGEKVSVLDQFAGSGAIPLQARLLGAKVTASDIDPGAAADMKERFKGRDIEVMCCDARALPIADSSFDRVVTDPPWGEYDSQVDPGELYAGAFSELKRVLRPGGRAVVLSGAAGAAGEAAARAGFNIETRLDVLVNGKKAAVFKLS